MSLAELLVSVLILGLSSQVALQGWVRVLDLQRDARTTEQTLQSSDQLLLAARRLLSSTTASSSTDWSAEASCRLALPEAPELAACAASLGSELTSNELVAIFSLLDVDHNGKVDFEEFENWWSGKKPDFDYSMV